MKVVCDNCRAVYKVPDDRLTKAVNKATCRNCGHRMLIPRPKPNADPEERTLVTAVPPTPVGAPPRRAGGGDEGESTLPGRAPSGLPVGDDLHMATPMMAARIGDTLQAPDAYESDRGGAYEPDPATHIRPSMAVPVVAEQPTGKPTRPPPSRPPAPAPAPPPRRSQTPAAAPAATGPQAGSWEAAPSQQPTAVQPPAARSTPGPADRRGSEAQPLARRTPPMPPPRQTPAPSPARGGTPASAYPRSAPPSLPPSYPPASASLPPGAYPVPQAALHDPAADLNWALLGTILALMGSVLLSTLSLFNHPLVLWFGLAMTFGGGVLSLTVLLTGARGRRPAQTLLSVVLGFLVAIVMSSLLVGTKWGVEKAVDAMDIRFAENGEPGLATPTAPPAPSLSSVSSAPSPAPAVVEAPPEPEPVVEEPEPEPVPGSRPRPKPAPRPPPAPRPQPRPEPFSSAPAPAPVAAPQPSPAPAQMVTVPIEAVDVMVKNNIEVKKCFVPLFKAGALPPRVDAKFSIAPTGQATGVTVLQQQYRGTELEACLGRAIGAIRFPQTSGPGTSITYPFILQ